MRADKGLYWTLFLLFLTAGFGFIYAVHNTDPHHWGFITSMILEYMRGGDLFTQIYVQYGAGQPILFAFLGKFLPVNYTTLGFFTSVLYAGTLLLMYLTMRRLAGGATAALLVTVAVLVHSYAIYPWPDYYAGFFLAAFCWLQTAELRESTNYRPLLAGAFLFLSFFFRNTYLLNLTAAAAAYLAAASVRRDLRSAAVLKSLGVFLLLVAAYLLVLVFLGDLHPWFMQTIGAGHTQYGVGAKAVLKLAKNIFLWDSPVTLVFCCLTYVALYVLWTCVRGKAGRDDDREAPALFFFTLLGLCGFVQAADHYEMFRLQNSSYPLYLVMAVFCKRTEAGFAELRPVGKLFLIAALISLAAKYPHASALFRANEYSLSTYAPSTIPYYRWHRFRKEEEVYYEGLAKLLCDGKSPIVNLTRDASIPYLCEGQRNALVLPFYSEIMLPQLSPERWDRIGKGDFDDGELVVSDGVLPPNPAVTLREVGWVMRTKKIRFLAPAKVSVYVVKRAGLPVSPGKPH